jgi:hypothetical protein
MVHGGEDAFWKTYKQSMQHIWCKCTQTETLEETSLPGSFPGSVILKDGTVSLQTGPSWLVKAYHLGVKAKGQTTRLTHFCATRNFPAPNGTVSQCKALAKHQATLTSLPERAVSEARLQKLEALARRIAIKRVNNKMFAKTLINPCHVSVTNRSSYGSTLSQGGRAAEVQIEYELWANRKSALGVDCPSTLVWNGAPVIQADNELNWSAFIVYGLRDEEINTKLPFGTEYITQLGVVSHIGFNQNVGIQLIQAAYEAGIEAGVLRHDKVGLKNEIPYGDPANTSFVSNESLQCFPRVRTAICGEPGLKNRIYTISEWWVTILLQPLGHILTEALKTIPQCRSGLSRSDAMWDWVNDFRSKPETLNANIQDLWLLTSDLETATDYCDHIVCRRVLHAFFEGLGLDAKYGRYIHFTIDLLLSSRWMETIRPS